MKSDWTEKKSSADKLLYVAVARMTMTDGTNYLVDSQEEGKNKEDEW
jgi:hypothetical protein